MARKKIDDKPIVKDDPARIIDMPMEAVMHQSMMPYAEHVILERALPRVEDGLKPVQRRILYTMMELGTTPDKPHRKCARIVGDCLGKYHPHGDSSVYGALVRMAQPFALRATMVDGHGNFGSIDGDGAAAMRYTEARMTPLALQMLRDIEKDTVTESWNFDDTLKEPDVLPARFPNLLINGASGIAVGLATNIPTHNFGEAVRATIAQIENPDISLDELMKIMPGPDFPTGGVLLDTAEIRNAYETGRGKLLLRAKTHFEDGSAGRKLLVIDEIPYEINKAAMLEKILRLSEEKKAMFAGIYDIRDESDREGMRAVIELRKDANAEKILAALYKYSDLQVTFGVNMVAIAGGKPMQLGLKALLHYYIEHQKDVVRRRCAYELKQAEARAHILEGLMIAVDNIDEVIRLIRSSKTVKEAREKLMNAFQLDEIQAQAILDLRLQRLTNLEILALKKEYEDLQKVIARLQAILKSEKKLLDLIRKELEEIAAEFGDERRTQILKENAPQVSIEEEKLPAEEVVVAYTNGGAFKRMNPAQLKKTPLPTLAEDEKESARYLFECDTDHTIFVFTDLGNCYPIPVSRMTEVKVKDRGQMMTALVESFEKDENVLHLLCVKPGQLAAMPDLLFVTEKGQIKRTAAGEYDVRSKKFAAVNLKGADKVMKVLCAKEEEDVLLLTRGGMVIRFSVADVPQQGRASQGVRAIQLENDDSVVLSEIVTDENELILITDRGYAKRIPANELEKQSRAGKGARAVLFYKTGTNGRFVAGSLLCAKAPMKIRVTQVRTPATVMDKDSIPLQLRAGKGVPLLMALMDDVVTGVVEV